MSTTTDTSHPPPLFSSSSVYRKLFAKSRQSRRTDDERQNNSDPDSNLDSSSQLTTTTSNLPPSPNRAYLIAPHTPLSIQSLADGEVRVDGEQKDVASTFSPITHSHSHSPLPSPVTTPRMNVLVDELKAHTRSISRESVMASPRSDETKMRSWVRMLGLHRLPSIEQRQPVLSEWACMQEVYPRLFISNCYVAADPRKIADAKITHIVKIGENYGPAQFHKACTYLELKDFSDRITTSITPYVKPLLDFVGEAFATNADSKVLVHCEAGISRSCAMVAVWLITCGGFTADAAVDLIRSKRRFVRPNMRFMGELYDLKRWWHPEIGSTDPTIAGIVEIEKDDHPSAFKRVRTV